jgi:hypothetical protein
MGFWKAIGDPFGIEAQKKANAANEARYQQALKLYDEMAPQISALFGQAREQTGKAAGILDTGYQKQLGSLGLLGARGRGDAESQGKALIGQQSQNMMNSGLATSSRLAGLARGVARDTARAKQSVNEGVAAAQSSTHAQYAAQLAQLQSLLGNSYMQQSGALSAVQQNKINTITSRQDVAGPGWLSSLGNVAAGFGSLLGAFGGGGGGAGGGTGGN